MDGRTVNACALLTATMNCAFGAALLQGPVPLEGWRYSHIVSVIQVPRHVYSEFAFSAIVISSEGEKPLSVFIFLTYFPRETLNPSQQKRRCEITIISFSRSICRGGLAALIGVTGKPYPSCLSCHSHPIRPCGAPSPRWEGCDTRIPSSKKRRRSRHESPEP